jgi:hypothetical protein
MSMSIPPTTALLHALGAAVPMRAQASRAAAPVAAEAGPRPAAPAQAPLVHQAAAESPPARTLPRGSLLNVLA